MDLDIEDAENDSSVEVAATATVNSDETEVGDEDGLEDDYSEPFANATPGSTSWKRTATTTTLSAGTFVGQR